MSYYAEGCVGKKGRDVGGSYLGPLMRGELLLRGLRRGDLGLGGRSLESGQSSPRELEVMSTFGDSHEMGGRGVTKRLTACGVLVVIGTEEVGDEARPNDERDGLGREPAQVSEAEG